MPQSTTARPPKIGMISLGCAKNLVDAEIMLGGALSQGMEITSDADEADVLIVNTCAFIDSAKEESIEAILEAHQQRGLRKRKGQKLIVSGCMAQRFSKELIQEMPEVDAFIGLDQIKDTPGIIEQILARPAAAAVARPNAKARTVLTDEAWQPLNLVTRKPVYIPDWDTPRFRLTPAHTAFTKIAEGCNHPCSFCVIPQMRGRHRSRTIESVVNEVRGLVAEGVKEINLISQDTTYYGMDLWEEKAGPRQKVDPSRGTTLVHLLHELQKIEGEFWIRLLYTHPAHWSDELIRCIAECDKVCRYIDMPLQHIHPRMLEVMRRETSSEHIEDLIARIRAGIPGIAIRTTFIVGFPGETEEEFQYLLDFIERTRFERLGVFKYSQEEGSRAAKMEGQLPDKVKQSRYNRAMELQQKIAREISDAQVGKTIRALVDESKIARGSVDAPDIDGRIRLTKAAPAGEFIDVKITKSQVYDLVGEPILRK
ncbi:MAG TPA: 30S ribosomal protein S12 methylthiotransferase RimO [Chthoniobacteraceae bacterium]|nr:30S ribosomal protein S12 methylthiotransferase RimO [Chthoniobacteraceae bacterium]